MWVTWVGETTRRELIAGVGRAADRTTSYLECAATNGMWVKAFDDRDWRANESADAALRHLRRH